MDTAEDREVGSCSSLSEDSECRTNEARFKTANCDMDLYAEALDFEDAAFDDEGRVIAPAPQNKKTDDCGWTERSEKLGCEVEGGETVDEDADVEDGEIESRTKCDYIQRNACRFHQRGRCAWGNECHSMHLSDKGLYNMLDSPAIAKFIYQQTFFRNRNKLLCPSVPLYPPWGPAERTGGIWDRALMKMTERVKQLGEKKEENTTVGNEGIFVNRGKYSHDRRASPVSVSKRRSYDFTTRCCGRSEAFRNENDKSKMSVEFGAGSRDDPWMMARTLSCRPKAMSGSFASRVSSRFFCDRPERVQSKYRFKPSPASTHRSGSSKRVRSKQKRETSPGVNRKREKSKLEKRCRRLSPSISLDTCISRDDLSRDFVQDDRYCARQRSVCREQNRSLRRSSKSIGRTSKFRGKFEPLSNGGRSDMSVSPVPYSSLKTKCYDVACGSRLRRVSERCDYAHSNLRPDSTDVFPSGRSPGANFQREAARRTPDLEPEEDPSSPKRVPSELFPKSGDKESSESRLPKRVLLMEKLKLVEEAIAKKRRSRSEV